MHRSLLLLLSGVLVLAACAPARAGGSRTTNDAITLEEIRASGATNAYALIESDRPMWMRTRGTQSFREEGKLNIRGKTEISTVAGKRTIAVYLDNARLGGVDALKGVTLAEITSIAFFGPQAATLRWGSGHSHGVILLSTRPVRP